MSRILSYFVLLFVPFTLAAQSYQVTVGGQPVSLHEFPKGSFGSFEITRPVTVEIRTDFDVRWVDVRPRSANIRPAIAADHGSVSFRLDKPVPLTVEFNGDWKRVLHLFSDPPEKDPPAPGAPNVKYFGPGMHEAGTIDLKDGETLYLAAGAWVKGNVNSVGAKNVVIRGRGVLDSSTVQERAQGQRSAPGRRNMIYLEGTQGARIEGITLVNSPTWTVYARRTQGTRIDGIHILNGGGACGTDGIDLVSSSDAVVENVFIRTNDDNIVVKNLDGTGVHDILVRHAVLWNEPCGNALDIGFELREGVIEKVRYEDIDVIRVERGSVLGIHNGDSAIVRDIVYDDIRVEDARHKLIDFAVIWGRYGTDRPDRTAFPSDPGGAWDGVIRLTPDQKPAHADGRGHLDGIQVRGLRVVEGALPFSIVSGFDKDHAAAGVTIEGLQYLGRPIRSAAEGRFSLDNAPGFSIR